MNGCSHPGCKNCATHIVGANRRRSGADTATRPSRFRVRQMVVPLPARVSLLCGISVLTGYPDLQATAFAGMLVPRLTRFLDAAS